MYRISYTRVFSGLVPRCGCEDECGCNAWDPRLCRETKEVVLQEKEATTGFPETELFIHPETAQKIVEAPPGPERILEVNSAEWVIVHKIEGANFVEL